MRMALTDLTLTLGQGLRRYRAMYALLAAWLAMAVALPTSPLPLGGSAETVGAASSAPPSNQAAEAASIGTPPPGAPGTSEPAVPPDEGASLASATTRPSTSNAAAAPGDAAGSRRSPVPAGVTPATTPASSVPAQAPATDGKPTDPVVAAPPLGPEERAVARTRSGLECRSGVRQFASAYAPPCRPAWTGTSAGATYRGVTAETIKLVSRRYGDSPDNVFAKQAFAAAGTPSEQVIADVRDVFIEHFNQVYELFGRRVVIDDYTTSASVLDEGRGKGRERACADATEIAEERRAFGALPPPGFVGLDTFSQCAVEHELFLPIGPLSYPETWFRQAHPFAYGIEMECERLVIQYAEYVGKRLAGSAARWARDPLYQARPRVFGFIAPDFGAYRHCADLLVDELERYGVQVASRYDYVLDPSTLAQQTAQAVVQFKAAGVTTLLLGAEFVTAATLTSQARSQQWGPEWVILGAGRQDVDGFARLFDQDRVDGHLFGLSGLGATEAIQGPSGEPARLYKQLTGKALPAGTDGDYFVLVHLFNLLQNAGPDLTPSTIAAGAVSLPAGGAPGFDIGAWSFASGSDGRAGSDHTAVDDAREVYWDGSAVGNDGKAGTYVATHNGRRFTNGQWPDEDPPIYPGCTGPTCSNTQTRGAATTGTPIRPARGRQAQGS